MSLEVDSQLGAAMPSATPAEAAWVRLIMQVDREIARYQQIDALVTDFKSRGIAISTLGSRGRSWTEALDRMLELIVQAIAQNPTVQKAVDAVSTGVNWLSSATGLSGLEATGAWVQVVRQLQPRRVELAGLGNPLMLAARGAAVILTKPAVWVAIKDILLKITPWVAGAFITDNIQKAIQGNAETAEAKGEAMTQCLNAARTLSDLTAQRAAIERCGQEESSLLWLALGGAAGVGALLYLQSKQRA